MPRARHRRPTRSRLASWVQREPVRAYAGSLLAAVIALAAGYGLLDGEAAALWLAAGTAALGFPVVEGTRARVTPTWPPDVAGRSDTP